MIILRSDHEIDRMALAGRLAAECMQEIAPMIRPGVTTAELDRAAKRVIIGRGGRPSFLGYRSYPASLCASVNEEVVHGIPGPRRLRAGDIVGIDLGVILDGYQGDMARTFPVGAASDEAQALIDAARDSFEAALAVMVPGKRLGDIGHAVQTLAESRGYGVVRELCGHGIGRDMHEDPEVPNYGEAGRGLRLRAGMVLAVEPMINAGTWKVSSWKTVDRGHR